jgi:uncharacterized membrane protein YfcA
MFPHYFHLWQLPVVFLASLIGESWGSLIGSGSIATLPALLLSGLPLQHAIAVDNTAAIGTELGIVSETWEKIKNNWRLVLIIMIPMFLGGIVGTWLLIHSSVTVLKYVLAAAISFTMIHAYVGRKKGKNRKVTIYNYILLVFVLFIVGVYSNSVAAGEGTLGKLSLMTVLGLSFMQSQGIKAAATIPSRLYMLVVGTINGLIVWPYLIVMWVGGFIAGKYATRFASRLPDKLMKVLLTVVSIWLIVYLLFVYKG